MKNYSPIIKGSIWFFACLLSLWLIFIIAADQLLQEYAVIFDLLPTLFVFWGFYLIIRRLMTRQFVEKLEIFWLFGLALGSLFYGFYAFCWIIFFRWFGLDSTLNSLVHLFGLGTTASVLVAIQYKLRLELSAKGHSAQKVKKRIFFVLWLPAVAIGLSVIFFMAHGNLFQAVEIFYIGTSVLWFWGSFLLWRHEPMAAARRQLAIFLASSLVFVSSSVLYGWQLRAQTYQFGGIVDWLHGLGAFLLLIFVLRYFQNKPDEISKHRFFYNLRFWLPGVFLIIALFSSLAVYNFIRHEALLLGGPAGLAHIWPRLSFELMLIWFVAISLSVLVYVLVSKQADLRYQLKLRTASLRRRVKALADAKYYLDNINDGVLVANPNGKIKYVNQTFARHLDLPMKTLKSKTLKYVFSAGRGETFARALKACQQQGAWHGEFDFRVSGRRRVLSAFLCSFGRDSKRLMLVVSDITQRKQIEEDKSQFVAFVSHQLREPLVEMRWLTENLLSNKAAKDLKPDLTTLHQSILHEADFVGQLLDISRLERGILKIEARPLSCQKLVEEAVRPLHLKARQLSVQLDIDPIPAGYRVLADQGKLIEVLRNIIDNALKYTRKHSRVGVVVKGNAKSVDFLVTDQGTGIAAELRDKIFEIKKRNDKRSPHAGAGLGLHFSQRMVEAMGGEISFKTSSQGTVFTISLPAGKKGL